MIKSFNSWAFKREQPDNFDLLRRDVAAATAAGRPIPFVLYWGRGPRTAPAEPEQQCFEFLSAMFKRIEEAYPSGASATLILTDTHAELNGYCPASTKSYFDASASQQRRAGSRPGASSELMESGREHLDLRNRRARSADPSAQCARRFGREALSRRRRGGGRSDPLFPQQYAGEAGVENAFRGAIFVTFNGSDMRLLFPEGMPIFYMYSIRRGVGVKPWFMPAASVEAPRELELA